MTFRISFKSIIPLLLFALGVCQTLLTIPTQAAENDSVKPLPRLGRPGGDRAPLLERFDQNKDGILNKGERIAARSYLHEQTRERTVADIMKNDRNKDGKITQDEFPQRRGRRRGPSLESADSNGDGGIDAKEAGESIYQSRFKDSDPLTVPGAEKLQPTNAVNTANGLYDESVLRTFFLQFEDNDWLNEMHDFYRTDAAVPADLTVNGRVYENVGVRYRGNSSFSSVPPELKRSLDINISYGSKKQRLFGYKTINLLNGHGDPTYMREVLYSKIGRNYFPAFRANFVKLVINGESWGIYPNIQQYNKDFLEEWFGSSKGVRWKGRGSLTYEGSNREGYSGYIAKTGNTPDQAWTDLANLCRVLKETSDEELLAKLNPIFNIDGALWSIALENVFVDEGYLIRGSDYNLYQDKNRRFHLLQHDGNEVLNRPGGPGIPRSMDATQLPLYHEADNEGRPVVHRLLNIPQIRARYTAHVRTIIDDWLNWEKLQPIVASYKALLDSEIKKDIRKESGYEDFVRGDVLTVENGRVLGIKQFVEKRRTFLLSNPALTAAAPVIKSVTLNEGKGQPIPGERIPVSVETGKNSIPDKVVLHWSTSKHKPFQRIYMADGSEGVFTAAIPKQNKGEKIHYYIEALSSIENPVASYMPTEAEFNAFTFKVKAK
ncbi:MAG TPA: hypothetical protein EYQ50_11045 [Verrucomicrobiales bacterium]|nr:hypothetical protein [Verrucomicrobiales bacterium]